MDVQQTYVESASEKASAERLLIMPVTEVYREIDQNSNVFDWERNGEWEVVIDDNYGNFLFSIDVLVRKAIRGERAFSGVQGLEGSLKQLPLGRTYYPLLDTFLAQYSTTKVYSPEVDLFFEIFIRRHGLAPGVFGKDPDEYRLAERKGDIFSRLIQEIAEAASQRSFKRLKYRRTEALARAFRSGKRYVDALFERFARLLVLRVDFGFRTADPTHPHPVGLQEAQEHLGRFLNNKRSKTLYSHLKGYIWRLEYGTQKGYHFHFFFFFDGSRVRKDEFLASEIGNDWIAVTEGKGIYHNCNAHKRMYKRLAIGMISHDDEEKRANLLNVLAYLHKEDQLLREKYADKTRGWGRGTLPGERGHRLGRPRRRNADN